MMLFLLMGTASFAQSHYVMIETNMGNMKVMLYDDTPKTVANFLKKVREGYYDGSLFGRVIPTFMIQGGAPDSKTAAPGQSIGWGDIDEEIPAEIRKIHVPKRGALCAPHRENVVNSDMSMFFIVEGYVQSEASMKNYEKTKNAELRKKVRKKVVTPEVQDSLNNLKYSDPTAYNALAKRINQEMDSICRATPGSHYFTKEEHEAYSTVGGSPHLYGDYTIYGEVVEGLEVIGKISSLETNAVNRPTKDVRMKIRVIQ